MTGISTSVSKENQKEQEEGTAWLSIYVLSAICCFAGVQFSVFFTSLWPFLNTVDPTASAIFFGIITAGFSLGQALCSPVFGMWMNKSKSVRWPIATGIIIMIVSNVIYCFVESFHGSSRRYVMLVARFFIGSGAGIIGVLRAYAANASTSADRGRAITYINASYAFGITVGPGVQAALTPIGYPGWCIGALHVDMYTAPAWFAVLVNLTSLFCLFAFLEERYVGVDDENEDGASSYLPKFDRLAAGVCILTQFTQMFIITNVETIGSMFAIMMFSWTREEAVKYMGLIQAGQGVLGMVVYIAFAWKIGPYLSRGWGRERGFTIAGIFLALLYHVASFPWSFNPGQLSYKIINATGEKPETVGCDPSEYSWCGYTHHVDFWVYLVSNTVCMSLAMPILNVAMNTLYSRILGNRRQGTMQGIHLMAGSIARTIGPLLVSSLFEQFGPATTWGMEIATLTATLLLWVVFYRRLIPLDPSPQLKPGEHYEYDNGVKYRF